MQHTQHRRSCRYQLLWAPISIENLIDIQTSSWYLSARWAPPWHLGTFVVSQYHLNFSVLSCPIECWGAVLTPSWMVLIYADDEDCRSIVRDSFCAIQLNRTITWTDEASTIAKQEWSNWFQLSKDMKCLHPLVSDSQNDGYGRREMHQECEKRTETMKLDPKRPIIFEIFKTKAKNDWSESKTGFDTSPYDMRVTDSMTDHQEDNVSDLSWCRFCSGIAGHATDNVNLRRNIQNQRA